MMTVASAEVTRISVLLLTSSSVLVASAPYGKTQANFTTSVKGELLRCNKKVDLAILLDSSASLSDEDFETAKRFAKELTKRFTLDKNRTRLSVVSFSHYKKIPFKFQDFYSQEKVFKAVDEFYHEASTSLLGGALAVVQNGVFNVKYGSRPKRKDVKGAIVVVTDGDTTGGAEILQMYSEPVKGNGIEIFAVALTDHINYRELKVLVSQPVESHIFTMKNSKDMNSIITDLVKRVC